MEYQKCDRCGRSTEENENRSYNQININSVSLSGFNGNIYYSQHKEETTIDLCYDCHNEIYKLLRSKK